MYVELVDCSMLLLLKWKVDLQGFFMSETTEKKNANQLFWVKNSLQNIIFLHEWTKGTLEIKNLVFLYCLENYNISRPQNGMSVNISVLSIFFYISKCK